MSNFTRQPLYAQILNLINKMLMSYVSLYKYLENQEKECQKLVFHPLLNSCLYFYYQKAS